MPPQENSHLTTEEGPASKPMDATDDSNKETETLENKCSFIVHPTVSLPVLNFLDMFSVALVVPLLNQYFRDAGVESASLRELLNSVFSSSQIIGSLVIGALSDSGVLSRKYILYLSFLGSAVSYSLIVYSGIQGLIISRVVVGAVKQTSTVSTSMISTYTSKDERSKHMGRLTACAAAAFMIGPAVGGYLYKHVDKKAPALIASLIFVLNFFIAAILLPNEKDILTAQAENSKEKNKSNKFKSFTKNLKSCFTSKELSAVVISTLIFHFVFRATSYSSMASYYEEMFGIEPHQRGYLSSYQSILSFLFQSFFVQSTLQYLGGEYKAVSAAAGAIAFATMMELSANFYLFLGLICPLVAVSNSILRLSLRSLVTLVAPKESLGSVLAALDVLQNAASVSVPFYRTILFKVMACASKEDPAATMTGDPCPRLWLTSSLFHWILATVLMAKLLSRRNVDTVKKNV